MKVSLLPLLYYMASEVINGTRQIKTINQTTISEKAADRTGDNVLSARTNFCSIQVLVSNKVVEGKVPHATAHNKKGFPEIVQHI